jgi:hypothetical protein
LIVSGPGSLDVLRKSFLAPYLPAEPGELRQLTAEELATLGDHWTLRDRPRSAVELRVTAPWSGVQLNPAADAAPVKNTGGLLVERQVGRGRAVVSAFQLDERDLLNWRGSFDSFFNACLLRRPTRAWNSDPGSMLDTLDWSDYENHRREARLVSGVRFFSRDTGTATNWRLVTQSANNAFGGPYGGTEVLWRPSPTTGGVGAWNDFSLASNEAREVLRKAAGVQVPRASFVVGVLAAYLFVLVPMNYLVFYALGRLEWAWIAAPLIAILGTVVVVWQAQLDIGFVRSQTEIGILELQGGHSRGHLTRYTAVYTSLGTAYDLKFKDPTALAAPFPSDPKFELLAGQTRDEVVFHKHDEVQLTDLGVTSSTTSMIHSEQMFDVGGAIRRGKSSAGLEQVENLSDHDLKDVAILQRTPKGFKGSWIGDLRARSSAILSLIELPSSAADGTAFATERSDAAARRGREPLDLGRLIALAQRVGEQDNSALEEREMFPIGEMRLVGRLDEVLPGLEIEPQASQIRGAVLVVAHLEYPPLPEPRPDKNSRLHIMPKSTLELEAELGQQEP